MKKLVSALALCGLTTLSFSTLAEDSPHTVTGNLGFFTDYAFRGVSQTNEDPAMQGGFDYAHSSGFYAGVWGSNVDYGEATLEADVYGGYAGSIGDIGYNVGLLEYLYPGNTDLNTTEVYGGVTYKGFGLKASVSTSDYFGALDSDGTIYWDASYGYTFANKLALGLHYGYTAGEGDQDDYADYKIGVTMPVGKYSLGLAYVDTDKDGEDLYGDNAEGRVILSVSTTF